MKVRQTLALLLILWCTTGFAQSFSIKDASGCAYDFKITSKKDHEVALVSASNKKCAKLEIPGSVINKGVEYTVTKVLSESLKDCDTELRVLTFTNTVKEIEGFLFGSALKLMGGVGGAMFGGKSERSMSTITLENLRIPASVVDLGTSAFVTSVSTSGSKGLKTANIEELPKSVVPFTAEGYGLQQSAVRDYWEKHDPNMLSSVVGVTANMELMQSSLTNMSPRQRSATLKMIQSDGPYAKQILQPYEAAGLTREDVIALLKGEKIMPDVAATTPETTPVSAPVVQQETTVTAQTPVASTPAVNPIVLTSDVDKDLPQANIVNENTFVVIIANEHYQEEAPVEYANNDGAAFKMYCQKVLGVPEENIHIRQDATLNNMLAELDWLSMVSNAFGGDAKLIVFYAGHGIPDEATGAAYLLPVDGIGRNLRTGFSLTELYKQLGALPAKNITVFMDACFSGSKRGDGMLASARGVAIKAKAQAPQGKMVVLSAAQGDETAYPYKEKQHGLFTYFLLKKLQETKGDCTLGELSEYVKTQVSRRSVIMNQKSQTPATGTSSALGESWKSIKLNN